VLRNRKWTIAAISLVSLIATAAGSFAAPLTASATPPAMSPWGSMTKIPGLESLGSAGNTKIEALACASAGNCVAGGRYTNGGLSHGFVANEVNGVWSSAVAVPGLLALDAGHFSYVDNVACPTSSRCTLTGQFGVDGGASKAFVDDEVNGTWGTAQVLPGVDTLGSVGSDYLACSAPGDCTVTGYYTGSGRHQQSYVIEESNGTWGQAAQVPGTAALNVGGDAETVGISCPSTGYCTLSGHYKDGSNHYQDFVADEVKGTWGNAQEVPGTATLNTGGDADSEAISCASAGNCVEAGYLSNNGHRESYEASEVKGTWGTASILPGSVALDAGHDSRASAVSCPSAGNCVITGYYADAANNDQTYVESEVNGTWGTTQPIPAIVTLNQSGDSWTYALSCASAGNCVVGGYYDDAAGLYQNFVAKESGGVWGSAEVLPGTEAVNIAGDAEVVAISCPSVGYCVAAGDYIDANNTRHTYVSVNAVPSAPTQLVGTSGYARVTLKWNASSTFGLPITGYQIFEGTAAHTESITPVKTLNGVTWTATITGLAPWKTYYFVVKAVNGSGASATSNEVAVVSSSDRLGGANSTLSTSQQLTSSNGAYVAMFQTSGNFVVMNTTTKALGYQSKTTGAHKGHVLTLTKGALKILDTKGKLAWSPKAKAGVATSLVLENNGSLELIKAPSTVLWTGTKSNSGH